MILGVSARAAAFSAIRAGYVVLAADCFCDEDLVAACDCRRVDRYPAGFEVVAAAFPDCPWLYTGGLENHPKLVGRIAERRQLLGNSERVLRQVRNPFELAEALRHEGLPCLDVSATPPNAPAEIGSENPANPAAVGGLSSSPRPTRERLAPGGRFYYQRYVAGTACSAVFVAANAGPFAWGPRSS